MTTMGKILVFVNFLFAVLTAALIIMVFTTRTHWAKGYEQAVRDRDAAVAEKESILVKMDSQVKEKDKELATVRNVLKDKDVALNDTKTALKQANLEKQKSQDQATDAGAAASKALASLEAYQVENKNLQEQAKTERERVLQLGGKISEYAAKAIKAENDFRVAQERNQQLLIRLVEAERKLQATQAGKTADTARDAPNPPPDDIKGHVTGIDDSTGWVTINLGTDNGLLKGNTLEVYRYKPKPTYVGVLRIYDIKPHEAIGKLMGTGPRGRVLKDDEVASRILGSN